MVVNDPNNIQDDYPEELVDMINNNVITDEITEVINLDDEDYEDDEVNEDDLDDDTIDEETIIDLVETKKNPIIDLNEVELDDDDDDPDIDDEYGDDYDDD